MQLSLNLQLLKKRGKHQSEHLSRFDSLLPVRQWVTWIRSKSCLLASSIFLKLFSTSLVLSTSFFICLMYSTDARSMVPLFQRTSLRRRHSFQILPLLFLVFFFFYSNHWNYSKIYSQVIGFGNHVAQFLYTIIDVKPPPPFNYRRKKKTKKTKWLKKDL